KGKSRCFYGETEVDLFEREREVCVSRRVTGKRADLDERAGVGEGKLVKGTGAYWKQPGEGGALAEARQPCPYKSSERRVSFSPREEPNAPRELPGFVDSTMVTYSKLEISMSSGLLDTSVRMPSQRYKPFLSKLQFQLVQCAIRRLQDSGFYWGAISGKEANHLLALEPSGTFLLRDSSDNHHFFTLSVKTESGTKNLRIQCDNKSFFLQTDSKGAQSVPRFECILKLVHHYMPWSVASLGHSRSAYYIYTGGEKIPLELLRPLPRTLSSLQHLCRKTVNGHTESLERREQLPRPLRDFLQEYDAPI
ncbi:hypothetical protein DNTS_023460, partial [Danionella cerebrum]